MSVSVSALKREFEIRKWSHIIQKHPYVAVLQVTGGRAWGRTNMKARILGPKLNSEHVGARFAVPRSAREGALRTRFHGISELFRSAPSAVVYGDDVDDVVSVVKRAKDTIDGGILVGGRFGEAIVTARVWEKVLESEGEKAEWARFIGLLAARPPLVGVLENQHRRMVDVVSQAGGGQRLVRVLDRMHQTDGS